MFLLFLLMVIINRGNSSNSCRQLSNECRFEEAFDSNQNLYEIFVCDSLNNKRFELNETKCKKKYESPTQVYFKLSSPEILDRSLNFNSLNSFIREMKRFTFDRNNLST